jgi:hypothetical protein
LYRAGFYAQQNTTTADECFDKCDADFRCAAACYTSPFECRFYKFGFKVRPYFGGSSTYIKPEVIDELAVNNNDKLSRTFPVVKTSTRLFGHYKDLDTLTPAHCFNSCVLSKRCGGATFTTDRKWPHNCFLCDRFRFTQSSEVNDSAVSAEFWTSYIEAGWTPELQPLIASGLEDDPRSKNVLENTELFGREFAKFNTSKASECFDKCDADARCAAASSKRFECELLKYGFSYDSE